MFYDISKTALNEETKTQNQTQTKKKKQAKGEWLESECSFFREHLRTLSNKYNDPENQELHHEYHTALKQYKKIINP